MKILPEWTLKGTINLPSANETKLPHGKWGNIRTVQVMKRVAHERKGHPLVRRLALAIIQERGINSHQYLSEARAIGEYVQSRMRYVKDPVGIEQLHDPLTMIEQISRGIGAGDCDDMSLLIATLLLSIGIRPYFRCVRYRTRWGHYNHIYVVVYEKNLPQKKDSRLVLDAIIKDKPIGFEVPHMSGKEYLV